MIIESSALSLGSSHQATRTVETRETLNHWITPPAPPASGVQVTLSDAALSLSNSTPIQASGEDDMASPGLTLLKRLIERMTGRKIVLLNGKDFLSTSTEASSPQRAASSGQNAPSPAAGWGMEYSFRSIETSTETTRFSATGVVTTGDGRLIRLNVDLQMSRSESTELSVNVTAGDPPRKDPLVINLGDAPVSLSDIRFDFDLSGTGRAEQLSLLSSDSGYLALDRNGNGRIDSGTELFGPGSGSGFQELSRLDQDHNGWIDEADQVFTRLSVWTPAANGPGQLKTLKQIGIGAINTNPVASPFSLRGNQNADLGAIAATGLYLMESGKPGTVQEVDLTLQDRDHPGTNAPS